MLFLFPLYRGETGFHNCYKVALTLHGTRLWVKTYYEFLFHLDNGFKNFLNYLPMLITWEILFLKSPLLE